MKIYFIGQKGIPALYGGVERHVEELSTRLAKQGHEVFVYCRTYYTPKALKEYQGVKLIHLPTIKTKHLDAIFHTFLASLDVLRRDADIIHYQAIGPSALLWLPKLLKRKAKIVSTFHCDDRKHQKWGLLARKCLGLGAYISSRWPHKTIGVSKNLCETHSLEFSSKFEYVPNGVAAAAKIEPDIIKSKWNLSGNDYVLAVARLIKHKGLHYLIKAYSDLGLVDRKLVIVGDSSYTDDYCDYLKSLAGDNKNIIFTGNQTGQALAELYSNAYLFVQPSEAEGFSIALLEAMSYGKGVLVSDIGPNKEAIANIGLSFTSKNIADLSEKLKYLLDHPQEVTLMGSRLQDRAINEYNWEIIAQKTVAIYKNILGEIDAGQLAQVLEAETI